MCFREYPSEDIENAPEQLITIYYKIENWSGKYIYDERTLLITRSIYDKELPKFYLGNNTKLEVSIVDILNGAIILKGFDFENDFIIPESNRHNNQADEIIIKKGENVILKAKPILLDYSDQYTIGVKEIKYGELLET